MENAMRRLSVEKVTINVGVGEPGEKLDRIAALLSNITGSKPVKTKAHKRIPEWGLRPGLEVGVKVTLRGKKAEEMLPKLLKAIENKIPSGKFDENGNFSFGIAEYVYISGVKYDYTVGMVGLSVAVTLKRPGFSVVHKRFRRSVGKSHLITKQEAMDFVKEKYGAEII